MSVSGSETCGRFTSTHLQVRSFRNLAAVDLEPGERFNVVSGDNGQGKTNLLEAVYVAGHVEELPHLEDGRASSASAPSSRACAARSSKTATRACSPSGSEPGARLVRIDDKRPPSLAAYAVRTPIVVFHPGEMALSMGASARATAPARSDVALSRARSRWPSSRRTRGRSRSGSVHSRRAGLRRRDLVEWETLCVRHGLALMEHRARAAALVAAKAHRGVLAHRGARARARRRRTRRRRSSRRSRVPRGAREPASVRPATGQRRGRAASRRSALVDRRASGPGRRVAGAASRGDAGAQVGGDRGGRPGARRAADPAARRRLERARSRRARRRCSRSCASSEGRCFSRRRGPSSSTRATTAARGAISSSESGVVEREFDAVESTESRAWRPRSATRRSPRREPRRAPDGSLSVAK